jgi:hypothetical protein
LGAYDDLTECAPEEVAQVLQTVGQAFFSGVPVTRWGENWGEDDHHSYHSYLIVPSTDAAAQVLVDVVPAFDFCYLVILIDTGKGIEPVVCRGKQGIFEFTQWRASLGWMDRSRWSQRVSRYFVVSPHTDWLLCEDCKNETLVGMGQRMIEAMRRFEDGQAQYSQTEIVARAQWLGGRFVSRVTQEDSSRENWWLTPYPGSRDKAHDYILHELYHNLVCFREVADGCFQKRWEVYNGIGLSGGIPICGIIQGGETSGVPDWTPCEIELEIGKVPLQSFELRTRTFKRLGQG